MTKFRLLFNKDKEVEWLNEMSGRGWALTGYFLGFYSFVRCEPGEYAYQMDFTDKFGRVSADYREFMAGTGVEIVEIWGWWVILRKKASQGEFQMYTDVESRIEHYTKIRTMFKAVIGVEIMCLIVEVFGALDSSGEAKLMAKLAACGIAVLLAALTREVLRINGILAELKGRIGKLSEEHASENRRDGLLAAGLGFNALSLVFRTNYDSQFLQGVSLALAVVGTAFLVTVIWRRLHR